jgi:hypothetical protein
VSTNKQPPQLLVDEHGHPFVAVIHEKKEVSGWPEKDDRVAGKVIRVPLTYALTRRWPCDAHMVSYSAGAVEVQTKHGPRLASELRLNKGAVVPGGYTMQLAVFDVDGPLHDHKAAIKSAKDGVEKGDANARAKLAELEARTPTVKVEHEEWWQGERAKIERLYELHNPVAYRTTNGYRLLGWFDYPMTITSAADRETWAQQYLIWLAYLRSTYSVEADVACAYCECLFRLPYVKRDGRDETPETNGDPDDAYWCFTEVDDEASLAEAMRLWPGKFGASGPNGHSNGRGVIEYEPAELLARWDSFSADEQQRRIDLYIDDLATGLEPSTDDNSNQATRLVAARSGIIGFGIGDLDLVMDLMIEHWVPRCDQSWSRADLVHKVEDAAKSTHQEIDFNLPEIVEERLARERVEFFGHLSPATSVSSPANESKSPATSASLEDAQARIKRALDRIC